MQEGRRDIHFAMFFFSDVTRNLSFCCLLQIERIQSLDVYNTIGNKCPSLHRANIAPR